MSLPMIISMLIQALYNLVDSLFIANMTSDALINSNALTAVGLCFPVQSLVVAFATGTGVGMNALLSKSLGEKKQEQANRAAGNGILLIGLSYFIFLIFGLFFIRWFFEIQTANEQIIGFGVDYLSICILLCFGQMLAISFERVLVATGRTVESMISQASGAVTNIIFDPLLIFGIGPFPVMGVKGAAIATVMGQMVSMVVGFTLNKLRNKEISLKPKYFVLEGKTVAQIYKVAAPSILMQSIGSFLTLFFNKILLSFRLLDNGSVVYGGTKGVEYSAGATAFTIYYKVQSVVFMPLFGLNNGMVPIVAYNYGAKKGSRIRKTVKSSVTAACAYMFLWVAISEIFPNVILNVFNATDEVAKVGAVALRVLSIHYLLAGASIILSSVQQALGSAVYSLIISLCRQLIVLLPAAIILANITGSVNAVWWSFVIAEGVSLTLCIIFYKITKKKKIAPCEAWERENNRV